jgi:hypothetical protein
MKKAYVIFPTLALLIFFGYWWSYKGDYDAKLADKAEQAKLQRIADLEKEAKDRELAIKEALINQDRIRKEREAKEAQKQKDLEARQLAKEASQKAFREKEKLTLQYKRLNEDIQTESAEIAKLEARKQLHIAEESFLRQYVSKAEANQNDLTQVIQKLAAADAAAKAIAAAADAAAKKS